MRKYIPTLSDLRYALVVPGVGLFLFSFYVGWFYGEPALGHLDTVVVAIAVGSVIGGYALGMFSLRGDN